MLRQHVLFWKRRSKRVSSDFRDCITFRLYVTHPYWSWNASREGRTCRKASSCHTPPKRFEADCNSIVGVNVRQKGCSASLMKVHSAA